MPCVQPPKLLQGQKALVTGASSGIGRAIALSLGDAGADVVINYVSDEDKAEALADEIRAKGGRARILRADVSDEAQVSSMFGAMPEEFGTLDILVNNAGLQQDGPFHELTLAQWNKVLAVPSSCRIPMRACAFITTYSVCASRDPAKTTAPSKNTSIMSLGRTCELRRCARRMAPESSSSSTSHPAPGVHYPLIRNRMTWVLAGEFL
jgi:NAD(P)-dependent dehydrogenase (short-subunit alcohol dehydrogenase family)